MKFSALLILLCGSLCFTSMPALRAQSTQGLMKKLLDEDSAAITALALYPSSVRSHILETCTYPELLVRMDVLQKNSSESFRKLLAGYSRNEQEKLWELTRYPGLIAKLGSGKHTGKELEIIAQEYPVEIGETIVQFGESHYNIISEINLLNISSENLFESTIKDYPSKTKIAARELLKYPDILSILTSHMNMAVLAGDIYKKQPELIIYKLDSISVAAADQNARDLKEWQEGLEKNPEARKEMEESAKEFAKEQGYTDDDLIIRNETIVVNYVCYPYAYWFGYPWWHSYSYWYPYPYWYDWGYYWGPYGIVYIGFPSPHFTYWYFYHHHHHYHYPHFTDYCLHHYHGHRKSTSGFNREIDRWVQTNEANLPQHYFAEDAGRVDRIREFGKFETDYSKWKEKDPGKNVSREDFLRLNESSFPNIKPVLTEKRPPVVKPHEEKRPYERPVYNKPPVHRPPVKVPKETRPPVQPKKPSTPPRQTPKTLPKKQPKPPVNKPRVSGVENTPREPFAKLNEAGEYHRLYWNGK